MNIFFVMERPDGALELITAPLSKGDILPGVTRRSVIELAHGMNDLVVSEREVCIPTVLRVVVWWGAVREDGDGMEQGKELRPIVACPIPTR